MEEKEGIKDAKQRELSAYQDSDPRILEEKGLFWFQRELNYLVARLVDLFKKAVNRVTDNIWVVQGYFIRECQANRDDINTQLGIDEDELDETI